jgi:hypothetical protein
MRSTPGLSPEASLTFEREQAVGDGAHEIVYSIR